MNDFLENLVDQDSLFMLCEGPCEVNIMNILFDNNLLKISKEQLIEFEPIHVRSATDLERDYLNKDMMGIKIIRILDSKNRDVLNFRLSKLYKEKVSVVNCVTSPEIEMLMIIKFGKYDDFKRKYVSKLKASEYVTQVLKIKNPKHGSTIKDVLLTPMI